jgi:uncharacterized integral membrane protein
VTDASDPVEHEKQLEYLKKRQRRIARALGAAVLVVAVAAFVVQNSQSVKVRFWFVTGHPRLIWVILACLAAGLVLGLLAARSRRVRFRRKRGDGRDHEN